MRLKAPNIHFPKWVDNAAFGLFLLAMSPIIAAVAALVGVLWLKRRLFGPTSAWQRWFAWRPVQTRLDTPYWPDREWRWLEMVERQSDHLMGDTVYRQLGGTWESPW